MEMDAGKKTPEAMFDMPPRLVRAVFALTSCAMALTIAGHVLRQFKVWRLGGGAVVVGWAVCGLAAGALAQYAASGRPRRLCALLLALSLGVFVVYVASQGVALSILRSEQAVLPPEADSAKALQERAEKAFKSLKKGETAQGAIRNSQTIGAAMILAVELSTAFVFLVIVAETAAMRGQAAAAREATARANALAVLYLVPSLGVLIYAFFAPAQLRNSADRAAGRLGLWFYAVLAAWALPLFYLVLSPLGMLKILTGTEPPKGETQGGK